MAVPTSKDELIDAIDRNFSKLSIALARVPENLAYEQSFEGHMKGTKMSVANLVSYLIGWNELVLKWLARTDAGETVDFPETGFKWNELGRLAQKFYADYEDISYPELLNRLDAAKGEIINQITARSNEELYGRPWYGKWTMGRMIQFNTSSPYENARGRVRKWTKEKNFSP